jgi:hypothetical protein
MKHAEIGQLYRRNRAQQPAFLGHNRVIGVWGKLLLKTRTDGRVIPRPFVCLLAKLDATIGNVDEFVA